MVYNPNAIESWKIDRTRLLWESLENIIPAAR